MEQHRHHPPRHRHLHRRERQRLAAGHASPRRSPVTRQHDLRGVLLRPGRALLGDRELLHRRHHPRPADALCRTALTATNGVYRYGASGFPTSSYRVQQLLGRRRLHHRLRPGPTRLTPGNHPTRSEGERHDVDGDHSAEHVRPPPSAATRVIGVRPDAGAGSGDRCSGRHAEPAAAATCPCTIFTAGQTPANPAENDTDAVELGVKFRVRPDGFITGVRFYKGTGNTGTHTGSLWTAAGARLATVTFTGETATGWQQATSPRPVAVTANTTYVASLLRTGRPLRRRRRLLRRPAVANSPLYRAGERRRRAATASTATAPAAASPAAATSRPTTGSTSCSRARRWTPPSRP